MYSYVKGKIVFQIIFLFQVDSVSYILFIFFWVNVQSFKKEKKVQEICSISLNEKLA